MSRFFVITGELVELGTWNLVWKQSQTSTELSKYTRHLISQQLQTWRLWGML